MPRFSIVIPIYGRVGLFQWTLEALLGQRFKDWEAIIVDDGSNEPAVSMFLAEASKSDPRIRTLSFTENRGQSVARNCGIAEATGEYIALLDTDDLYLPWTLELLNTVIERERGPSFIVGAAMAIDGEARVAAAEEHPLDYETFRDFIAYRAATKDWWFAPSGTAIKTSVLREAGGFWPERDYFEDVDLWLRIGTAPGLIKIRRPVTYGYRLHDANAHHNHYPMYAGLLRAIDVELAGGYPGGKERRRERISSLAAHARHHALEFSAADPRWGWDVYLKSFPWNVELGRWKFILGFPVVAARRWLRTLQPAARS